MYSAEFFGCGLSCAPNRLVTLRQARYQGSQGASAPKYANTVLKCTHNPCTSN